MMMDSCDGSRHNTDFNAQSDMKNTSTDARSLTNIIDINFNNRGGEQMEMHAASVMSVEFIEDIT